MDDWRVGEYIIYVNGSKYELGRIKALADRGAFVCYHEGETAALTPFHCMHKLVNGYCIQESALGGPVFMRPY